MSNKSTMTASAAVTNLNHIEEMSPIQDPWLSALDAKTVVFYAKPLISKWLKVYKTPAMIMLNGVNLLPWQKRIKPRSVELHLHGETELMVLMARDVFSVDLETILSHLKEGGAFLWVTQNRHADWPQLSQWLEDHNITDLFAVGFHPKGAIAWWPFDSSLLVWLGYLLDCIAPFFPGRRQASLRFGRYWLIRGFKRYDRTELH